ncbi:hypothetical protein N2K95_01030 [Arthrobacter zhaoxinii]|uniref:Serine protease inhibitor n=1 Tax=Arthrobacter zhaoxinii TaxID=2964616 RepID=A0ABY5YUK1_9MICC|nr:hypothetical protein [Arthrobacter zhaoxinii]UWX97320.1 hypothetical protein N2K95_01030 [Arthrobacter zhaoxinii]
MRNIQGTVIVPLLLCTAVLLAACGGNAGNSAESPQSTESPVSPVSPAESPSTTPPTPPAASPAPSAAAPISLTVEFKADGTTTSSTWTLQCDGAEPLAGSTVPDPAGACALLAEQGAAALAEPAAGLMCKQQISGMQRAHVTGTVNGASVDANFSLRDGCQTSRWERLTALLGPADGAL